jgi:hypothetical protein
MKNINIRKIDKTKKSNIKCEHCSFCSLIDSYIKMPYYCRKHQQRKNYWNRCKDFEWDERYND